MATESWNVYAKKTSDSGSAPLVASGLTEKSYHLADLDADTEMQIEVSHVVNGVESVDRATLTQKTAPPLGIPDAPTVAAEAGDGSADFTITPATNDGAPDNGNDDINKFLYRLKKTSDASWDDPVDVGKELTGTITDLENDVEYSLEAAAVNTAGQSSWDDDKAVHFTPKATVIAVTGVTLDDTELSVEAGATGQLTATVAPTNATDKAVTWTSSDEEIATVDNTGKVTGVAEGTATITAVSHADATKKATCSITVTAAG